MAQPQLNPVIGFFDPLNLSGGEFWGDSNAATIGFLREAEIKHGRVAMAGFVGYIVHANDIRFPWEPFASAPTGVSPQALWDGLPEAAKWQIILTVGFFEFWRENSYILSSEGEAHTCAAARATSPPSRSPAPGAFDLFDPSVSSRLSPEKKAALLAEVINGRPGDDRADGLPLGVVGARLGAGSLGHRPPAVRRQRDDPLRGRLRDVRLESSFLLLMAAGALCLLARRVALLLIRAAAFPLWRYVVSSEQGVGGGMCNAPGVWGG